MSVFIFSCLIFLLAGLVQGITGFGAGLVAIPLLCLIMDVKQAVPLTLLNGIVITSFLAYKLREHIDRRKILPLLIGSVPGILVGAILLKIVDPAWIRTMLGLVLVGYSSYMLFARPRPLNLGPAWAYVAGFCTGAITALLSAGGPPTIIYTTLISWKKDEIKATLTGFFVTSGLLTAVIHLLTGTTTKQTGHFFLATIPFVLLGTALGFVISRRINRKNYLLIVYSFLILMGILMLLG